MRVVMQVMYLWQK